jgi:hypothetical protein
MNRLDFANMCRCLFGQFTGIWLFKGTVACDCFLMIPTFLKFKTRGISKFFGFGPKLVEKG